ncbi:MAG: endonuclease III [Methyloligellaceae bacterium]
MSQAKTAPAKSPKKKTAAKKRVAKKPPTEKAPAKKASHKKPAKRGMRRKISTETIGEIFARFAAAEPEPKGELEHTNAFTLLVAVVLSAQATDAGVNRATRDLFAIADTPEKMVALGEDKVRDYIRTIGLYRNKAKNVIALSQQLIDEFGSEVPADRDTLELLPGVGRKTANVIMNVWFREPTMAVDTHVFRIANRLGLAPGKTPLEVEEKLLKVVPSDYGVPAHHWLILHGRYICTARKPACPRCIIRDLCIFPDKTPDPEAEDKKVGPCPRNR